jgi:hypothetical protein
MAVESNFQRTARAYLAAIDEYNVRFQEDQRVERWPLTAPIQE